MPLVSTPASPFTDVPNGPDERRCVDITGPEIASLDRPTEA